MTQNCKERGGQDSDRKRMNLSDLSISVIAERRKSVDETKYFQEEKDLINFLDRNFIESQNQYGCAQKICVEEHGNCTEKLSCGQSCSNSSKLTSSKIVHSAASNHNETVHKFKKLKAKRYKGISYKKIKSDTAIFLSKTPLKMEQFIVSTNDKIESSPKIEAPVQAANNIRINLNSPASQLDTFLYEIPMIREFKSKPKIRTSWKNIMDFHSTENCTGKLYNLHPDEIITNFNDINPSLFQSLDSQFPMPTTSNFHSILSIKSSVFTHPTENYSRISTS